jgi:uncharacterized protein YbjT (DUF2867 family)
MNICVIGGTGFIGSRMVAMLVSGGHSVTVPTRKREHAKHLVMLPTCTVQEVNVHDAAALPLLIAGHDAVINLVGILHGNQGTPYGSDWQRAHVDLPRNILAAMKTHGVKRYLHMSAMGADPKGPSMYQRSKGDGEALVAASDVAWTIFRPSVVFGPGDKFLNTFVSLQRLSPVVPLAGAACLFQPVQVDDVAQAFANALASEQTQRQTYELAGPETFTLKQLVQAAGHAAGVSRPVIGVPSWVGRAQVFFLGLLPGEPLMSGDNLDSMHINNTYSERYLSLSHLGIVSKRLSDSLEYLRPDALRGRFDVARSHAGR